MPNRDTQINLRVTEGTRDKWRQFAEKNDGYDGLSDLIRTAVTDHMRRGGLFVSGDSSESGTVPQEVTGRLSAIEDELDAVSEIVQRTDDSVGFIEDRVDRISRQVVQDEMSFTDRLMRAIPPAKPLSDKSEEMQEKYGSGPVRHAVWEGTVDAIADALETEGSLVEQSLNQAYRQHDKIKRDSIAGETRYWAPRDPSRQPYADGRSVDEEVEQREVERRQRARGRGGDR